MKVDYGHGRRRGMISARDALVFVVIALVAVVLIEGIIISNITAPAATLVRTSTLTVDPTGSTSASTVTVVSTTTGPVTTSTATYTTVLNLTITNSPTTSTSTTENATSSTTSTTNTTSSSTSSTLTPTTNASGTYVVIPPGTATSGAVTSGYDPDHIVVVLGINNTVTWVNEDSVSHTVTSRSSIQPFNSGQIKPGGTFTFTFTSLGTFTFTCDDFAWMSGAVTVEYR